MSDPQSETEKRADSAEPAGRGVGPAAIPPGTAGGQSEPPSLFLQIVAAIAIALLAVVAAQSFFTGQDVSLVSQNVGNLAVRLDRLQSDVERNRKILDEVPILRGQVGEVKNILRTGGRLGGAGGAGEAPPGPADWTGIYVSELAPLLPILAQHEGEMGEAWIYSDNENFLESIARALEALAAEGMDVNIDQPQ